MQYVNTENLKTGAIIAKTIYGTDGRVLIKTNTVITPFLLQKLHALGHPGIYIFDPGETETSLRFALDEETRLRAARHLKNLDLDKCIYVANEIVTYLLNNKDITKEVSSISAYDMVTWTHSVDVCTYAVMLGIAEGYTNKELNELSQAALLHDIGKCLVNRQILNKPGRLTDDEFAMMKNHPEYGRSVLTHNTSLSAPTIAAVYAHHENEDGSGYPRGATGDHIHRYAKIIHICDVYEACTARRPYKKPMNPADALENLMAGCGNIFDKNLLSEFCLITVLYPTGRKVLLSNGNIATVVENRKMNMARPVVKTQDGQFIDLMETLNITILKLIS